MAFIDIEGLPDHFAVIDLDTGTVLNKNLVLVNMRYVTRTHPSFITEDDISSSDSLAHDIGTQYGKKLFYEDV